LGRVAPRRLLNRFLGRRLTVAFDRNRAAFAIRQKLGARFAARPPARLGVAVRAMEFAPQLFPRLIGLGRAPGVLLLSFAMRRLWPLRVAPVVALRGSGSSHRRRKIQARLPGQLVAELLA